MLLIFIPKEVLWLKEDIKNKGLKKEIVKRIYKILSLLISFVSSVLLWRLNVGRGWSEGYKGYFTLTVVGGCFCLVYWFFVKLYQAQQIGQYRLTELTFFHILSFGIADVVLLVETFFWFHGFHRVQIESFVIAFILQVFSLVVVIFVCNRLYARYDEPRRVVIIYGDTNYRKFIAKVRKKHFRYKIASIFRDDTDINQIIATLDPHTYVYLYDVNKTMKNEMVIYCEKKGISVYLSQDVEDWMFRGYEVSHSFDTPFICNRNKHIAWYYPLIKRFFDIVCSAVGLIVSFPLLLVVAICIKLYDKGPVIYKQIRLTKGNKKFYIYKFRSMIVNAEKNGVQLAEKDDNRITPIGKFIRKTRLDELPQLWNIFCGDMSFVGPRPERPEIHNMYLKELPEFGFRLDVKAGLTGYAQVYGKYNTSPEDKLKLDILYINRRSMILDLKLIFYTVKIMFIGDSAEGF